MLTDLTLHSWETILRRSLLMAQGTCSAREYRRMVSEKADAVYRSACSLLSNRGPDAMARALAPWHRKVAANARRLRRSG